MKRLAVALVLALLWGPAGAVVSSTQMPNAAYSATTSDQRIITGAPFTAARTLTLPAAGGTCIGQSCPANSLEFIDSANTLTGTNTITITPQSGDTINGSSSSLVYGMSGVRVVLIPVSGNNWFAQAFTPGGQLVGTATNDNACTGCVGEYLSSGLTSASQIQLTTATAANVTSVNITPGDWDCRGSVVLNPASNATVTLFSAWTSTTTASDPNQAGNNGNNGAYDALQTASITAPVWALGVPPARYSVSVTTSLFLGAKSTFASALTSAYGFVGCRRVR